LKENTLVRSRWARSTSELVALLAPLKETSDSIDFETLSSPIERFVHSHLIDAYRTGQAMIALIEARRAGKDVDAVSVEVLARKLTEQASVVEYAVTEPEGVERWARTHEHEWKRSTGHPPRTRVKSEAPVLPSVTDMAGKIDEQLVRDWKFLSHLSHPRGSWPYSGIEREGKRNWPEVDLFENRTDAVIEHVERAVQHVLDGWRKIAH
jgi:hypothetical protein